MLNFDHLDAIKTDLTSLEQQRLNAELRAERAESARDDALQEVELAQGRVWEAANATVTRIEEERDEAVARANVAEAALATIRAALGSVESPVVIEAKVEGTVGPSAERKSRRRIPRAPGALIEAEPLGGLTEEIERAITNTPGKAPVADIVLPFDYDAYKPRYAALLRGLTTGFQSVLGLHRSAKVHGYPLGNQSVRNDMRMICGRDGFKGRIEVRGGYDDMGGKLPGTLSWKLADPKPDGDKPKVEEPAPERSDEAAWLDKINKVAFGDRVPASAYDGLEDLRAAIEKTMGSKVGADFKAETPAPAPVSEAKAKRLERDRLLLTALGDGEGRTYQEWMEELNRRTPELRYGYLEDHRNRFTRKGLIARITGTAKNGSSYGPNARFTAWPTLAEALAKLEGATA